MSAAVAMKRKTRASEPAERMGGHFRFSLLGPQIRDVYCPFPHCSAVEFGEEKPAIAAFGKRME